MAFSAGAFGASGTRHRSCPNHLGKRTGAPLIHESLAPSQPTDPVFHGVSAGGAPSLLKLGDVRLERVGKLDLRVKGLVIPALGRPGPVTTISASLYCGADSSTTAADTTRQVAISRRGNARIHDASFDLPTICLAPVILVHPMASRRCASRWTAGACRRFERGQRAAAVSTAALLRVARQHQQSGVQGPRGDGDLRLRRRRRGRRFVPTCRGNEARPRFRTAPASRQRRCRSHLPGAAVSQSPLRRDPRLHRIPTCPPLG